jgi:hypothetical protein
MEVILAVLFLIWTTKIMVGVGGWACWHSTLCIPTQHSATVNGLDAPGHHC